jgi:hypothetical protein
MNQMNKLNRPAGRSSQEIDSINYNNVISWMSTSPEGTSEEWPPQQNNI